ncbi:MAG: SAM-dependent methyltransferase [Clostridia bacterium]|nr:SAM-dependent methyltransferase [Clostridia bacterium]
MNKILEQWKAEEQIAHIHGWDFSHIDGRYSEDADFPWDYRALIKKYLRPDMKILDYDTGGGEFLLSLNHPHENTAATEGFAPNIELCKEVLLPLGIDFRPCGNPSAIPFADGSFDMIIDRHGSFDPVEIHRLLKNGGIFITQQVGEDNDRQLVEMAMPGVPKQFEGLNLVRQKAAFENAGFNILESGEAFRPIRFYDIGAFVWFARIIQWEFPDFSVDSCLENLLKMQETIEKNGCVEGMTHRYMIVAQK